MRWLIAAVALLSACNVRTGRNAPGNVIAIERPPPGERGQPSGPEDHRWISDPGEQWLNIVPSGYFGGGHADGVWKAVAGVKVELSRGSWPSSGGGGADRFPHARRALTLGWDIIEAFDNHSEPGAISLEASRHTMGSRSGIGTSFSVGAGVVGLPRTDALDVGAQVSVSVGLVLPRVELRARYTSDSGAAVLLSYELSLPTSVTWSR